MFSSLTLTRRTRPLVAGAAVLALTASLVTGTATPSAAATPEEGLVVHYGLTQSSGTTVTDAIGGGATTANYLGRSVYTSDKYLKGLLRDFRVYDRAVTAEEARALGERTASGRAAADVAALDLGDTSSLGILDTGHHSIVQVPGTDDWYIAYHRFAIPGGNGTHREVTIDHLRFTEDGTIARIVPTLEGVTPLGS
jgi:hypothetical protein